MAVIQTNNGNIVTSGSLIFATSQSNNFKVDGNTILFLTASKVGVGGNVAPVYSLDVTGDSNVTGNHRVGGNILADNNRNLFATAISSSNSVWVAGSVTATSFTGSFSGSIGTAAYASSSTNAQTASYLSGSIGIVTSLTSSGIYDTGNAFIGGNLTLAGNFTMQGSGSVVNITSSAVDIGTNIILINAYSPFQRYAGISAIDSGSSTPASSSILWDSLNNRWIFQGDAGIYGAIQSSSVMIGGPVSSIGNESLLTLNTIPKATTGLNIGNSLLTDNGTILNYSGTGFSASYITVANTISASTLASNTLSTNTAYATTVNATGITASGISGVTSITATGITASLLGTSSWSNNGVTSYTASYVNAGGITNGTLLNSVLPSQINVTGITASLLGTASWAINSVNNLVLTASANQTYYVEIASGVSGSQVTYTDSLLTFNPSTNVLMSPTISASVITASSLIGNTVVLNSTTYNSSSINTNIGSAFGGYSIINGGGNKISQLSIVAGTGTIPGTAQFSNINGNTVGIDSGGNLSASYNLYVNGSIIGNLTGSLLGTASLATNAASSSYSTTSSYARFSTTASYALNSLYPDITDINGQFVGIFNSNPASPLDVVGNICLSGMIINTASSATSGNSNFIGTGAGSNASMAFSSNFIGLNAGSGSTNANYSNFIGSAAGYNSPNTNYSNFIGALAGTQANNAAASNFFGFYAGHLSVYALNSNFIGYQSGLAAISASNSNFIGYNAGYQATNANNSIFIGYQSGYNDTVNNTLNTGSSILIGSNTLTNGKSNSISIGTGTSNTAIAQLNLGNLIWANGIYTGSTTYSQSVIGGKVGIGLTNPVNTFDVSGNISCSVITASLFLGSASYAYTSSWALNAVNGGTTLLTGSTYPITSSWSNNGVTSYTASYINAGGITNGTLLNSVLPSQINITGITASLLGTASWAINSITATTASYVNAGSITNGTLLNSVLPSQINITGITASLLGTASYASTASYAYTSSWALNAVNGGTTLVTASTYPITSSWSNNSVSSSFSTTSSWARVAATSSYTTYLPYPDITDISSSHFVGIANTTPNSTLDVVGNISLTGYIVNTASAIMPANSTFIGTNAGYSANAAVYSIFMGYQAGYGATNANNCNFLGYQAGYGNTSSVANNSFGYQAGYQAFGSSNSNFLGQGAGYQANNAVQSNFIGLNAGSNATNAQGSNFFGQNSGQAATNAQNSHFIGQTAGYGATNAANSIFIGNQAGYNDTVNNYSGNHSSILIGDYTLTNGFNDSIAIGRGTSNTTSNQCNIGNSLFINGIYSSTTTTSSAQIGVKVGIGIFNPTHALDVIGHVSASVFSGSLYGTASVALTSSYSATATNVYIQGGNSFGVAATIGTNDGNILSVKTNGSTRLTFDTGSTAGITASAIITPAVDATYTLGVAGARFKDFFSVQTTIGALFETGLKTEGIKEYPTGTVLIWEGGKLKPSYKELDARVAGVSQYGKDEPIIMGAEPVLVTGEVQEGDWLVTSNKEGHATGISMESSPLAIYGKVIAQSLQSGNGDSYIIKAMIRKI